MIWTIARTLAVTVVLAVFAAPAGAQAGACAAAGDCAAAQPARAPDVAISASVTARELTFQSSPRASVRLTGCALPDTVRVTERRNLPAPVQPGVVYRDVHVAVEVHAWVDAECLLGGLDVLKQPSSAPPAGAPVRDPATCLQVDAPQRPSAAPR
ncbi:hypothetical protein [Longimicrobium sp.]|jgi:hypothetical protein|uniref:hypothetical protein n=1 Tax=Longimicrobium sp. TaxID=2029185 RepID=UPI002F953AE8